MTMCSQGQERRGRTRRSAAPLAAIAALGLAACLRVGHPAAAPAESGPLRASPDGRPLTLTFADEFNRFDRFANGHGVWRTVFKDGRAGDPFSLRTLAGNKELQLYVDPDLPGLGGGSAAVNPFHVHDGVLDIVARPAPAALKAALGGHPYASGLITTQPSFAQTYGYFEMRAKLPSGKGVWPAFWLLPADLGWPPEIDVMESIGDASEVYMTAHSKALELPSTKTDLDPDAFHTFAVSWDPKQLIWFIDGREVKRQPTPADMNKPMYMLANVAVGGGWPGNPDETTPWPARMSIDYIRAYRFAR
jgi:beta-glucanase (GH16 family)